MVALFSVLRDIRGFFRITMDPAVNKLSKNTRYLVLCYMNGTITFVAYLFKKQLTKSIQNVQINTALPDLPSEFYKA